MLKPIEALSVAAAGAILVSCAQVMPPVPRPAPVEEVSLQAPAPTPPSIAEAERPLEPLYGWDGTNRPITRIEVNVDRQKAVFYSGDEPIGWTIVASGVRSFPTPTGRYAVLEKIVEKKSNIYGKIYDRNGRLVRSNAEIGVHPIPPGGRFEGASMPYFLRLTGDGIGMHAGPLPDPGSPASHGCIRMPHSLAPIVFRQVDVGTPVSVVGGGPSYASYMAAERREAARRAGAAAAAKAAATKANAATSTPAGVPEATDPARMGPDRSSEAARAGPTAGADEAVPAKAPAESGANAAAAAPTKPSSEAAPPAPAR